MSDDELDDAGPITLGEIRRFRVAQQRMDRHRADIERLNRAVIALAKHTGYPTK